MNDEELGRIEGSWREAEAEENAADLSDYLRRVLWRLRHVPELVGCLERFEACTKGLDGGPVEHADIQYLRRWLVRLELKGTVRRGLPDYELALDRLESIERGSFSPLHRGWLFDAGELAELDQIGTAFDASPEFDFVSVLGFRCDCPQRRAFLVVHDGTPEYWELARPCHRTFRHGCQSAEMVWPTTFGECHTDPGGINGVILRTRTEIEARGIGVIGPYLFKRGDLFCWPPKESKVAS